MVPPDLISAWLHKEEFASVLSIPIHIRLEKKIVPEHNMPLISASVRVSAMAVLFWRLTTMQAGLSRTEPPTSRGIGVTPTLNRARTVPSQPVRPVRRCQLDNQPRLIGAYAVLCR